MELPKLKKSELINFIDQTCYDENLCEFDTELALALLMRLDLIKLENIENDMTYPKRIDE